MEQKDSCSRAQKFWIKALLILLLLNNNIYRNNTLSAYIKFHSHCHREI